MWSTESEQVFNFSWHLTFLNDVSGKKTTLRKSNNVELFCKVWIGSYLLARFFSDCLKVIENFSEGWNTDLDAVDWCLSSFLDNRIQICEARVYACITEAMEDSGGSPGILRLFNGPEWRVMMLLVPGIVCIHKWATLMFIIKA